ncbi:MAG: hypothetical protein HW416_3696 [Chloroflexi bacterium]|nr:hypothetical protein [Chloroflexota bacterium]
MGDIELLDHWGFSVPDVRAGVEFYEQVLGAKCDHWNSLSTDDLGNAPHTGVNIGDFFFVLFPHTKEVPRPERPRGIDGSRHGYIVPRVRFGEIMDRLREHGVPFEGPVVHPEHGPLGEHTNGRGA